MCIQFAEVGQVRSPLFHEKSKIGSSLLNFDDPFFSRQFWNCRSQKIILFLQNYFRFLRFFEQNFLPFINFEILENNFNLHGFKLLQNYSSPEFVCIRMYNYGDTIFFSFLVLIRMNERATIAINKYTQNLIDTFNFTFCYSQLFFFCLKANPTILHGPPFSSRILF